jgi:3-deoxy-7-phosphoheptulonate synthase
MMIVMDATATSDEVTQVVDRICELGMQAHLSKGAERTVIGVVGDIRKIHPSSLVHMPGVAHIVPISKAYKLASREFHPERSGVRVGDVCVGHQGVVIIAGPCAVESRSQLLETAHAVREAGAHILRGGAFKPRTSPYSFQGLGEAGLELLAEAREITGMPVVTEVMSPEKVPLVARYADILQIGARNMQNYALVHAVGESQHPVLLKRGMSATVDEFLMTAEYILSHGNKRVLLCERGIRTFETSTRNTTDINAIPVLKASTHLPVILDPSHSTGDWRYVSAIARAGVAAGADGLMVEVHINPDEALSDGAQALKPERFATMVEQAQALCLAVGRFLAETQQPPITVSETWEISA